MDWALRCLGGTSAGTNDGWNGAAVGVRLDCVVWAYVGAGGADG
jgi:hypothetical protein